ncbi:MAG: endonuclease [Bacilli bacterium]|nr:endonuclease [Bacilli bacterium]
MVQLSVGDNWTLPSIFAIDDTDGNISNRVESNLLAIDDFHVSGNEYHFTTSGSYVISFSARDNADNVGTLTLTIEVVAPTYNWSSISYYSSLSSSDDVLTDLALLLRSTVDYVSYGDARYVYTTYENGKQVILYDVPTSPSYGKVTAEGLAGWGDGGNITGDGFSISINREHVWACNDMRIMPSNQDRTLTTGYVNYVLNDGSFDYRPDNENLGHFSDLHNLWNALASPNSTHSDHFYGEENGSSVGPYLTNEIFYPGDEYIGDIARILFYMTLMYPHLTLVEEGDTNAVEGTIYYGYLDMLLQWNEEDPVSYYEITRNQTIYETQGNRNPFIDYYSQDIAAFVFANGDPNISD